MRRLVLVPLVAVLVLAACGTERELPQLPLSATGAAKEGAATADMMMPYRNVRYELADGVKADTEHGDAYRFDNATLAEAHRIAKAFDVDGDPRVDESGWTFGENTGGGNIDVPIHTLTVLKNGTFGLNANGVMSSGVACAGPNGEVVCGETTPSSTTTVAPATFDANEAKRFALEKLKSIGVDLPDPVVTVPAADGYFFSVHVNGRIAGERVDGLEANVTLDQDKKITTASASISPLQPVGSYELATLQQAVDRLNNHVGTGIEPAIAEGEPGGEPTVVKLTAVKVGLMQTVDDNTRWLTPSYVFTTDEGNGATVSVAAAADKYFPTTTQPSPVGGDSGGGSTGSGGGSVEPAPPASKR